MIAQSNITSIVELNEVAIKVLVREIGLVNTGRFLSQYSSQFGNYTEERDAIIGNPSLEEICAEIRRKQPATAEAANSLVL